MKNKKIIYGLLAFLSLAGLAYGAYMINKKRGIRMLASNNQTDENGNVIPKTGTTPIVETKETGFDLISDGMDVNTSPEIVKETLVPVNYTTSSVRTNVPLAGETLVRRPLSDTLVLESTRLRR